MPVVGGGGTSKGLPFRPTSRPNSARCGFADTTRERGPPNCVRCFTAPVLRSERSEASAVRKKASKKIRGFAIARGAGEGGRSTRNRRRVGFERRARAHASVVKKRPSEKKN